jgi:phosphoglycolate phosphatase
VATRYREIYDAKTIELCPLFPGLTTMLDALQKAEIKISIATSKRRPLVEVVLKHHDLMKYFDLLVGAQDVSNHKPHPESVHITLDRLNVAPVDAVVIGDSTYDLDMARNAGVDAIGVTTGVHSEVILSKSEPKHIVAGLEDVLKIILNGRNGKLTH